MRDFAIHLSHKPGELGRVANTLARAGVNIKTVTGRGAGSGGRVRLIGDDGNGARRAFQEANIHFEEREVVTTLWENRAGELAEVADKLANGGLNLEALYVVGLDGDLIELAGHPRGPQKAQKAPPGNPNPPRAPPPQQPRRPGPPGGPPPPTPPPPP